jgi:hypothetical protein
LNPELYLPFDAVKLGTVIPKNLSSARCRHLLMEKFLRRFGEIRIAVRIVGKKARVSSPINCTTLPVSASSPSQAMTHWRLKYSLGFTVGSGASFFANWPPVTVHAP